MRASAGGGFVGLSLRQGKLGWATGARRVKLVGTPVTDAEILTLVRAFVQNGSTARLFANAPAVVLRNWSLCLIVVQALPSSKTLPWIAHPASVGQQRLQTWTHQYGNAYTLAYTLT